MEPTSTVAPTFHLHSGRSAALATVLPFGSTLSNVALQYLLTGKMVDRPSTWEHRHCLLQPIGPLFNGHLESTSYYPPPRHTYRRGTASRHKQFLVTQICNLPYRRIAFCGPSLFRPTPSKSPRRPTLNMDCGGRAQRRHRFGFTGRSNADLRLFLPPQPIPFHSSHNAHNSHSSPPTNPTHFQSPISTSSTRH